LGCDWEFARLFTDRRFIRGSLPWVVVIFAILNIAVLSWERGIAEERKKNLLVSVDRVPAGTARWDLSVGEDLGRYWQSIPDARGKSLVILSGMSQMYAINDARPRDETISELMDDVLSAKGVRVFGLAAPNLCNEEATLLLLSALTDPRTRPDVFIYGVCFDKFRNLDLRPGYQSFLRERPRLQSFWLETANEYKGKYPQACKKMENSLGELSKEKEHDRGTVETRLREWVSLWLPVVSARSDLNATFQGHLFLLRNWIFNIKPTSKRPVIEGRFELNKEFLAMMADVANRNGVRIIYYIIPLNPLADNPYIPEQYTDFKNWLGEFCRQKGVPFANLENVVPSEAWGEFMGGPDFKHFREEGHRLTASALLDHFGPVILGSGRATAFSR